MAVFQCLLQIGESDQVFGLFHFCPLEFPMLFGKTNGRLCIGQFRQPIDDPLGFAVGDVIQLVDEAVDEAEIRRRQTGLFNRLSVGVENGVENRLTNTGGGKPTTSTRTLPPSLCT